jgi:hypothetical protein
VALALGLTAGPKLQQEKEMKKAKVKVKVSFVIYAQDTL